MGTNYYAVRRKPSGEKPIHIGKNSYGWLFCFQRHNEPYRDIPICWNSYDDIKKWLYKYACDKNSPYAIKNEYDEEISVISFIHMVDKEQVDPFNQHNDNFVYCDNVNGYRFADGDFC